MCCFYNFFLLNPIQHQDQSYEISVYFMTNISNSFYEDWKLVPDPFYDFKKMTI